MAAETLKCPMCGASAAAESTRCGHCNSRLATIACPSCFGMLFLGARFCSHCGAPAQRQSAAPDEPHPCPRCNAELSPVMVGSNRLRECPRCEGIWADAASLNRIYSDREQQAQILGSAAPVPPLTGSMEAVRYLRCPACSQLMHRVNFARCSHVVVDVCKPHGTWFDKDELRRIVEFIREGGMTKARDMELRELERQRRQLEAARAQSLAERRLDAGGWNAPNCGTLDDAISAAASVARLLFRS